MTSPCSRCHGLMILIREPVNEGPLEWWSHWQCINCGNYEDAQIKENRRGIQTRYE